MERKHFFAGVLFITLTLALIWGAGLAQAQGPKPGSIRAPQALTGTSFTYQGRLLSSGSPANGTFDFQFKLYDALTGGTQVGLVPKDDITVTNGLFIVLLDFGSVFDGTALALEVGVRPGSSGGGYTTLTPRHVLWAKPYALALPGLYTQPNDTSPNVIGGYKGNSMNSGVVGGTIGGGGANGWTNGVTDNYGTVSGGYNNQAGDNAGNTVDKFYATVGGGTSNNATGLGSTIGGGVSNTASGSESIVGGGHNNIASGDWATIGGGNYNSATHRYATIPGGNEALAAHNGEMAYASGKFAAIGDAQTSVYVLRNTTTNATQTELFLNGSDLRLTIASNRAMIFNIQVLAFSNGGLSAGFEIRGLIDRTGDSTTMNAAPITDKWLDVGYLTWNAIVQADDTNEALVIKVTGDVSSTIRWVATVRTSEVAW